MTEEIFVPITGYEGLYEINTKDLFLKELGNILNLILKNFKHEIIDDI